MSDYIYLIEEKRGKEFVKTGWTEDSSLANRLTNSNRNLSIRYKKLRKCSTQIIQEGLKGQTGIGNR